MEVAGAGRQGDGGVRRGAERSLAGGGGRGILCLGQPVVEEVRVTLAAAVLLVDQRLDAGLYGRGHGGAANDAGVVQPAC